VLKSISHQLGTPMIAVLGYANLLTDPDLDEATRDAMAQHMTDRAWELAGMVEDLQALAQTELGDLRVVRVPVDLAAEVNAVIDSMGARGLRVTVTGDRPVIATGDPARIRQVVRSFLANAFTHGTEPVTVDVTATATRAVVAGQGPWTGPEGGTGGPDLLTQRDGWRPGRWRRDRPLDRTGAGPSHGRGDRVRPGARFDRVPSGDAAVSKRPLIQTSPNQVRDHRTLELQCCRRTTSSRC
jgi:hypothetical protein